ncbi:basic amino acid/polyamine antiporter [Fructilactobacillus vespulae]|uniref:basic amino acid/polyamine antiporter n=1 Tax=Fructilactobacillus vespulae TaxID=1249630 RepID=UPI0039B62142
MENKNGVSFLGLVMLVISSAIGAGIYNASSGLASVATPGPALLAWLITGVGIFGLALSLKSLSETHPELEGISDYAQAGFGNFAGFLSGWGYWLSAWLGNVAFATMMMSSIGYFIPSFRSGNSLIAVVTASVISWFLTILVTHGVESAAFINTIVTIVKLVPLVAFILLGIIMFKANVFTEHFWQNFSTNFTYTSATGKGVFDQVKGCIITMMWIFIGIEGATMMAGRAKKRSDASRATIIGFISLLVINAVISMLPYGYMSQAQLAKISNPALTYVVEDMIGPIGGALVSISLIITIAGAWLSWTMLPVEATSQLANQKLLPKWFGYLNKKNSPSHSLWLTQILLQMFLISLLFTDSAYTFAISLCTAAIVICYALVGAYQVKVGREQHSVKLMVPGIITVLFEIIGIVFAGLQFLWLCSIAYVLGFVFYIMSVRERGEKLTKFEIIMMVIITIAAITSIIALVMGKIGVS